MAILQLIKNFKKKYIKDSGVELLVKKLEEDDRCVELHLIVIFFHYFLWYHFELFCR